MHMKIIVAMLALAVLAAAPDAHARASNYNPNAAGNANANGVNNANCNSALVISCGSTSAGPGPAMGSAAALIVAGLFGAGAAARRRYLH